MLLAYNAAPSSTFLNQALACLGWGLYLWALAAEPVGRAPAAGLARRLWPALAVATLLAMSALVSVGVGGLPGSLAWSAVAMLAAAALVLWMAGAVVAGGRLAAVMPAWCAALLAAGVLSAVIALVQVFVPDWAEGTWIAATSLPGRAAGNLRQPNHLSTLVLWSLVALAWLHMVRWLGQTTAFATAALLVFAIVLSASRTGLVGILVLGLWGLADRSLPRRSRVLLLLMPVAYALMWFAMARWSASAEQPFGGATRFSAEGDISSSRFAIWSDTLALIARHPWFGVGFGEFNRAWSLTPFPHRPLAFFDHTHNLPLQFAVELGVPLAALLLGLLGFALWRAFTAAGRSVGEDALSLRSAFMLVLLMAVHSLLEYPLWYAYFLLPTAFALGLCLAGSVPAPGSAQAGNGGRWPQALAALLAAFSVYAVVDYWKVVVIFAPGAGAAPLAERIEAGKHSLFFAHHAHYAAATTAPRPSEAMASFEAASHFLLDTRLMLAWAKAYAEAGDIERARHLADRLREFRNAGSQAFLDACNEPLEKAAERPFQCEAARLPMDDRAFR